MADKPHILVVEDDEMVQDIVNHCLSSEGYRVTGVGEGVAMRKVMESDPAELVIMDIRLPGEDGFALTQYLHENYDVGVIIVSARTDHVDRVVGLEIGADDYVTKSFNERYATPPEGKRGDKSCLNHATRQRNCVIRGMAS
jgi:DNA-binding response OmpR family regulator